jgi:TolB-like protein
LRTRALVLPLGWLLLASPPAAAQQAPTIAVMDFRAFSVSLEDASALGRGLAEMIMTEMSTRPAIRVIERERRDDLLRRQQIALSGREDDQVAIQVGKLLGAHYIVTGSMGLERDQARLDIRMTDVETGEVVRSSKLTGKRDQFLSIVEKLTDEFTRGLVIPDRPVIAQVAVPVPAVLAFSRGLDYERRGRPQDARTQFLRALDLHPEYADAQSALERVRRGGR